MNENIWGILEEITEICGSEEIAERVIALEEEDFSKFCRKRLELIDAIVSVIREQKGAFDISVLKDRFPDTIFWEDIEGEVEKRTRSYLTVLPYRALDKEERIRLIKMGFDTLYIERETTDILRKRSGSEENGNAVFEVLMESEHAIVACCMSKRRFMNFVRLNSAIESDDMDYIWKLYEENMEVVEKIYTARNMNMLRNSVRRIEQKLDDLDERLDDLDERLDSLE